MRFSVLAAALATVASVAAQSIAFTSVPDKAVAGMTYTIQWSTASGVDSVDLYLRKGPEGNLDKGTQIASNLQNSQSFQWSPSKSLVNTNAGDKDTMYTFEIKYKISGAEESNYSSRISVSGGAAGSAGSSSSDSDSASASANGTTSTITSTTDMTTTMTMSPNSTMTETASDNSTTTSTESTTTTRSTATRTTASTSTPSSPNGGSVASSSSLAMVFCVLAAVFYIN